MQTATAATFAWRSWSVAWFVAVAALTNAPAQCANVWRPGTGSDGVLGPGTSEVMAQTTWDPDGAGPATPLLVVGGRFAIAGTGAAANIAAYDPVTGVWSALGSGIIGGWNGAVHALAVLQNGDLVAGGSFATAGGTVAANVARWNGSTWSSLGGGTNQTVLALCALANGDLIAGGEFTSAGGVTASRIARWDGATWSPLGLGTDAAVRALTTLANGNVVVGGAFTSPANRIASWNGSAWSTLGVNAPLPGPVNTLATMPNGDVLAAGWAGLTGIAHVQRWNGSTWSGVGSLGTLEAFYSLVVMPNGDIVAALEYSFASGVAEQCIHRWNGSAWSAVGPAFSATWGNVKVSSLCALASGDLVAGGTFAHTGMGQNNRIARWDGTAWSPLGTPEGLNGWVDHVASVPNGDLIAAGSFRAAGGVAASGIARWSGGTWAPLGSGMTGGGAVAVLGNGDVIAAGPFTSGCGTPVVSIARWNGTMWSPLGSGMTSATCSGAWIAALAVLANGDIIAGGGFTGAGGVPAANIARWNGSTWSRLGTGVDGDVLALAVLHDGSVVAGGYFGVAGGVQAPGVARWDGTAWSALGSGVGGSAVVQSAAVLPNGDLVVGGAFSTAGGVPASRIARWDGTAWSALGAGISALSPTTGSVFSLMALPNGDVLVGGQFADAGGIAAANIARWDGANWPTFGTGMDSNVWDFAALPSGDVVAAGQFTVVDGAASPWLAVMSTTCPASVIPAGAGCAGDTLTATLPWTGAIWRAQASGLPPQAVVFRVSGFLTISLPLATVFTTALPGCTLYVQPDVVDLTIVSTGAESFQFVLPNTPSLAGTSFHHQMLSLALDTTLAVTATNALTMTVGSF